MSSDLRRRTLPSLPDLFGRFTQRSTAEDREATRVELVALACEVVVLTSLMDDELKRVSGYLGADEIWLSCWEHRCSALQLLAADVGRADLEAQDLPPLIAAMRTRVQDVQYLRGRLQQMVRTSRSKPTRSGFGQLLPAAR